jgi:hypothetical protein
MNTEKESFPPTANYNGGFRWLLAGVWLIALAGMTYLFLAQNKTLSVSESSVRSLPSMSPTTSNRLQPVAPDATSVRTLPSMSPTTSNRLQPVAPDATSGEVKGMDSDVYTYVCHDLKIAPSRMQFRCRDGESFIDNIVWNEWKTTGASGKGILNQSDCSFGCQSPTYSKYPVAVKLSSPISDGKMVYFGRFDYLYVSASGREYAGVWDPTAVHDGRVISGNG